MIIILILISLFTAIVFSQFGRAVDEIFGVINNVAANDLRITSNLNPCYRKCTEHLDIEDKTPWELLQECIYERPGNTYTLKA